MENTRTKNIFIVILIILAIGLFSGKIKFSDGKLDFSSMINFKIKKEELVESVDFETNEIDNIEIKTYSTDIEIKTSDENIKVEYYSNTDKNSEIKKEGNSIIVDESNFNLKCVGVCNISRTLVVYIPSNYDGYFNIETMSGDIKSTTSIKNNIEIKTTSGDIKLLSVNDIELNTTSGDVKIDKVNEKISINGVSGDVLVKSLDIKENSTIRTTSGDVKIKNNISNCYVDASTTSGDKNINKSDRKSDIVLKIKTTSGDITIN